MPFLLIPRAYTAFVCLSLSRFSQVLFLIFLNSQKYALFVNTTSIYCLCLFVFVSLLAGAFSNCIKVKFHVKSDLCKCFLKRNLWIYWFSKWYFDYFCRFLFRCSFNSLITCTYLAKCSFKTEGMKNTHHSFSYDFRGNKS